MGCSSSSESPHKEPSGHDKERSYAIDKQLDDDARKFRREVKILLLGRRRQCGTGMDAWDPLELGAANVEHERLTVIFLGSRVGRIWQEYNRQADEDNPSERLLEGRVTALPPNNLQKCAALIFPSHGTSSDDYLGTKDVIDSAQALVLAIRRFKLDPTEAINRTYADKVLEYRLDADSFPTHSPPLGSTREPTPASYGGGLSPDIVKAIDSLWHDPIIPSVLDRSSEFYLMDSAAYFFDGVKRIGAPGYIPNESDVLHARTKTTGISETKFKSGQLSIHMFDVGGQRSERKKWIHCFEAVTSIIFCVALSEYDQVLLEETGQNRMNESLVLFESVINSRWFLRTSIILFLNKIDLFKAKLPKVPLSRYFPEYTGGADVNKGAKYILWRFTQLNRARLSIYPHLTQATDTSNIRLVFAATKETILQNALRDSGEPLPSPLS
ncbi:hypothetical protein P7C70_g7322, partial [Phenoliferia sp. Uapishka_3]